MGMLLSEKGIGPTADRVKAVLEVEEPKSASDVRSFLGLANYSSRFIPHFATLSEPLRRLTRKETPFEFGPEQKKSMCTEEYVRFVAVSATPTALTTREIEEASADDEELKEVSKAIATGRFEKCREYMTVAGELCVIGQLLLRGTRIIIPSKLQPRTLALAHEGHLGVVGSKQNLRTKVWWPGMDKAAGG